MVTTVVFFSVDVAAASRALSSALPRIVTRSKSSTNDRFDIRNARVMIQKIGIDISKVAWLINLSADTKLDDTSKKMIHPAKLAFMPFIDYFYGEKKTFMNDRSSRGKFERFLESAV